MISHLEYGHGDYMFIPHAQPYDLISSQGYICSHILNIVHHVLSFILVHYCIHGYISLMNGKTYDYFSII